MKNSMLIILMTIFFGDSTPTDTFNQGKRVNETVSERKDINDPIQDLSEAQHAIDSSYREFKNEANMQIGNIHERIVGLKRQIKNGPPANKVREERDVAVLEKRNQLLKAKLKGYQEDGKSDLAVFKTEFNHDLDSLEKSLLDFIVKYVR